MTFNNPSLAFANSLFSSESIRTQKKKQIPRIDIAPTPEPSTAELSQQYSLVPRRFNPGVANRAFDQIITNIGAQSGQAAGNAERAYAERAAQVGVPAWGAAAVGAGIRTKGRREVADVNLAKEKFSQDIRKDAASMAAMVATNLSQIRDSYSKTVADYNKSQAYLDNNVNQFNATSGIEERKLQLAAAQAAEEMAARAELSGGGAGAKTAAGAGDASMADFFPGYIPNSGPIIPGRKAGVNYPGYVFEGQAFDKYF